jgi:hypothetical protein
VPLLALLPADAATARVVVPLAADYMRVFFPRGLATAVGVYVLFRTTRGPDVLARHLRLRYERVREVVTIGTPAALEQSTTALAMVAAARRSSRPTGWATGSSRSCSSPRWGWVARRTRWSGRTSAPASPTALGFSLVALWLGRVPMVYGLAFLLGLGATGVWIGMATGHVLGALAAGLWFTRDTWKGAVVDGASASGATEPTEAGLPDPEPVGGGDD